MATQEVMLNDNVNLNFQFDKRVFKLHVNIITGIVMIEELHKGKEEKDIKGIITLDKKKTEKKEIIETGEE